MGIVKAIPQMLTELVKELPTIIETIVSSLSNGVGKVKEVGKNLIRGLWEGISDMASWIGDKIKGFGEGVLGGLKSFFGIHSPSAIMRDEVGKFISEGIAVGITDNENSPIDAVEELGDGILNKAKTINGATIRRQIETTFSGAVSADTSILEKLDSILTKLDTKTQIVLDSGVLVGETIGRIDAGLASLQLLKGRGV
jgi:phage-related protein